ncbi:hypothetical protein INS49_005856 [Diaporthe citri]|uniref:uncharacterized protein n=1 Tax=Diaporthe citri TaxID=83186 RepID=UPI001C7F05D6|nr:uncharacterized protein INS49_005856 [Diaporthe citri]KAG6364257.1 hypothetical protein INS49_005856 [Diaporthe citri]
MHGTDSAFATETVSACTGVKSFELKPDDSHDSVEALNLVKTIDLGGNDENGKFPLNEGYFILDPVRFDLGYGVFIKAVDKAVGARSLLERKFNNNTGDPDVQPRERARHLDNQVIPAACFDACNNLSLEAQLTGRSPGLCRPGSAFMFYYLGFTVGSSYLSEKSSQFLRYCKMSGDIGIGVFAGDHVVHSRR